METTHTQTWTAGQVFAGYRIIRELGAGGMGTVYLAAHPRLPREDALKVLPAHWTADPEFRARFVREAELAAGLSHPHIVGIQDRGEYDGHFWLSMDYVAGTDADRLLRERFATGMPLGEAVPIIAAVGSALDYAHHRGLLHRDVKPANILLADADGQPGRTYLADFGIARRMDDAAGLTATNMVVGTVSYAAPEQLKGEPVDGRTDQYALACTAFHLLTGAAPYGDSNPGVVIARHVNAPPPSIGAIRPELAGLDWVFARAMAKRPADRFASCREFTDQLALHPATRFAYAAELPTSGFSDPTQPAQPIAPVLPWPPTSSRNRKARKTRIVAAALSGVALLIAGAVVTGLRLSESHPPGAAPAPGTAVAPTIATPPPNTGPMTGTYQVEFGAPIGVDGKTSPLARPATEVWTVRSVCRPGGCVATAARVSGDAMQVPTMVLDEVGGRWTSTGVGPSTCNKAPGEAWESFDLQPLPGGAFSGEVTETMKGCANKRTVTFTRTGDVDVNGLPDPAALPPRTPSPGAGMHGRYHQSVTQPNGFKDERDWDVRTDCLRTGERCLTFFHVPPANALVMLYGDGNWTFESEFDARCSKGGVAHLKITAQLPLPQPAQDPIAVLSGPGREDATGSRCPSTDIQMTFTRVGD